MVIFTDLIEPKSDMSKIMIVPDYSYMKSDEWWSELNRRKIYITSSSDMNDFKKQKLKREKDSFEESKDYGMINWFRA